MKSRPLNYHGYDYPSMRAAARAVGISLSALRGRLDRPRATARVQKWHVEHRERSRAMKRRGAGMPEPTRPCPERCEICGARPGKRALHLDHDHLTGMFRGWLCSNCNTAIGLLRDSVVIARRLVDYLHG